MWRVFSKKINLRFLDNKNLTRTYSISTGSLKEDLFEKSIGTRDFQKQGKISSKKGYEVWRIVLSTKLRYGQEALAKIVQGKIMNRINFRKTSVYSFLLSIQLSEEIWNQNWQFSLFVRYLKGINGTPSFVCVFGRKMVCCSQNHNK